MGHSRKRVVILAILVTVVFVNFAGGFLNGNEGDQSLDRAEIEREIHHHVNEFRKEQGEDALRYDSDLRDIARNHSEDMANRDYFSHDTPGGKTPSVRYSEAGYRCIRRGPHGGVMGASENIALAYADTPTEVDYTDKVVSHNWNETSIAYSVVERWKVSKGHRENMLHPGFKSEGVGVAITEKNGKTQIIVTQNFC